MAKRETQANDLVVQDRDLSLLRSLFESRILTAEHIADLHFSGRREAAKKRLQKLKAAQVISARKRRAFEPEILFLAPAGLALLRQRGVLTDYPEIGRQALLARTRVSDLTLRHELEVLDVKCAFHRAIAKTATFVIAEFSTWPLLFEFEAAAANDDAEVLVRPDAFVRIHETEADGGLSEHTFFLEVDRSSETLDTLLSRVARYANYYRSGGFAQRNGAPRGEFRDYPFRVLLVFKTGERRNNFAERMLRSPAPVLTQVCLSTTAEATADPLGSIWISPADYRNAVHGSAFAPDGRQPQFGYQRQTARDVFVEESIMRRTILDIAESVP